MEKKILDYLFEKDYLNMDKIIEEYVVSSRFVNTNYTTYTLLNTVEEVMKYELNKKQ
jgi:hypothetical protein